MRVTAHSLSKLDQITQLIKDGVLSGDGGHCPMSVAWLSRVGFTSDGALASVPGFFDADSDSILYLGESADMEIDGERVDFSPVSDIYSLEELEQESAGILMQNHRSLGLAVCVTGIAKGWNMGGYFERWPKLREQIVDGLDRAALREQQNVGSTADKAHSADFDVLSQGDETNNRKYRVLGAHSNGNFFDIVAEARDGLSAFGVAAKMLKEADEDGRAEFFAAIPAGTDFDFPGDSVVALETVLEPEQADVFGLLEPTKQGHDQTSPGM
jgi:hypothetical protein